MRKQLMYQSPMKVLVALALLYSYTSSFALELSSSVYRVGDIDKARAEAAEKEKPLVVLYSNSKLSPI
ncbi:hypothetical protein [Rubritalea sp.]|uniref:hypothetical protein n=1 Tax=Rubritalea sp. TaxID=2109375 RepID=UPI003F4A9B39